MNLEELVKGKKSLEADYAVQKKENYRLQQEYNDLVKLVDDTRIEHKLSYDELNIAWEKLGTAESEIDSKIVGLNKRLEDADNVSRSNANKAVELSEERAKLKEENEKEEYKIADKYKKVFGQERGIKSLEKALKSREADLGYREEIIKATEDDVLSKKSKLGTKLTEKEEEIKKSKELNADLERKKQELTESNARLKDLITFNEGQQKDINRRRELLKKREKYYSEEELRLVHARRELDRMIEVHGLKKELENG